jgi:hypothetical protein
MQHSDPEKTLEVDSREEIGTGIFLIQNADSEKYQLPSFHPKGYPYLAIISVLNFQESLDAVMCHDRVGFGLTIFQDLI